MDLIIFDYAQFHEVEYVIHRYISPNKWKILNDILLPCLGEVDLVVIGSGPGGYVASIKAAQLGMKVCTKT